MSYSKDFANRFLQLAFIVLIFTLGGCKEKGIELNIPKDFCSQYPALCEKRFDEVTFLTTHNSYSFAAMYLAPNQTHPIPRQLADGVRGLMIDVYDGGTEAMVYHGTPLAGQQKLINVLQPIKKFLDENPNEVITIIFQNEGGNEQLEAGIIAAGLDQYAYIHDGTWPLMKEMVAAGTRLVMFVEHNKSPSTRQAWLHHAWATIYDTPFTYQNVSEFSCNINRGGSGTRQLYLVNHWLANGLGLPDINQARIANRSDILSQRLQDCVTTPGRFVNFLGVDFYHVGEAKALVDSINGM